VYKDIVLKRRTSARILRDALLVQPVDVHGDAA